jgi:hypothetical protein
MTKQSLSQAHAAFRARTRHYHVEKSRTGAREWTVRRVDQIAHIGRVNTKREAVLIARLLAGPRGVVTDGKLARTVQS